MSVYVDSTWFASIVVIIVSQVELVQCGQFVKWQYSVFNLHTVSKPPIYTAAACFVFCE